MEAKTTLRPHFWHLSDCCVYAVQLSSITLIRTLPKTHSSPSGIPARIAAQPIHFRALQPWYRQTYTRQIVYAPCTFVHNANCCSPRRRCGRRPDIFPIWGYLCPAFSWAIIRQVRIARPATLRSSCAFSGGWTEFL